MHSICRPTNRSAIRKQVGAGRRLNHHNNLDGGCVNFDEKRVSRKLPLNKRIDAKTMQIAGAPRCRHISTIEISRGSFHPQWTASGGLTCAAAMDGQAAHVHHANDDYRSRRKSSRAKRFCCEKPEIVLTQIGVLVCNCTYRLAPGTSIESAKILSLLAAALR